jgi:hypothetical protein
MFPRPAAKNILDGIVMHTIAKGYFSHATALPSKNVNITHLLVGKFGAGRSFASSLSLFGSHVAHVVGLCAREQMGFIVDAVTHITTVANIHACRYGAMLQLVGNAMGRNTMPAYRECAVTIGLDSASPQPTSILSLFNVGPEAFENTQASPRRPVALVTAIAQPAFCCGQYLKLLTADFTRLIDALTCTSPVSSNKEGGLTFNNTLLGVATSGGRSRLAATALTKAVGDFLGVFCYNIHAGASNQVLANPGPLRAVPGLFVPKISTIHYTTSHAHARVGA